MWFNAHQFSSQWSSASHWFRFRQTSRECKLAWCHRMLRTIDSLAEVLAIESCTRSNNTDTFRWWTRRRRCICRIFPNDTAPETDRDTHWWHLGRCDWIASGTFESMHSIPSIVSPARFYSRFPHSIAKYQFECSRNRSNAMHLERFSVVDRIRNVQRFSTHTSFAPIPFCSNPIAGKRTSVFVQMPTHNVYATVQSTSFSECAKTQSTDLTAKMGWGTAQIINKIFSFRKSIRSACFNIWITVTVNAKRQIAASTFDIRHKQTIHPRHRWLSYIDCHAYRERSFWIFYLLKNGTFRSRRSPPRVEVKDTIIVCFASDFRACTRNRIRTFFAVCAHNRDTWNGVRGLLPMAAYSQCGTCATSKQSI